MFMPTEEKINNKVDLFLNNNSVKIFACFEQDKILDAMVVSFIEQRKIEIIGIITDGVYALPYLNSKYGII